jgi:hypothetical protein
MNTLTHHGRWVHHKAIGGLMSTEELVIVSRYLKALLAVQVRGTNGEGNDKPELILSSVGLPPKEIADILGKNAAAVAKTIQRAGKATRKRRP